MKIRIGFVSNSSSSSFVLIKSSLYNFPYNSHGDVKGEDRSKFEKVIEDWKERELIKENYLAMYSKAEADDLIQTILEANEDSEEPWLIVTYRDFLIFSTTLDNFDLKEYLENLLGREIDPIIDFPSYCGFDHWHGSLQRMKDILDIAFPKKE